MKCLTAAPKMQPTMNIMIVFSIILYKRKLCRYIVPEKEKGAQKQLRTLYKKHNYYENLLYKPIFFVVSPG